MARRPVGQAGGLGKKYYNTGTCTVSQQAIPIKKTQQLSFPAYFVSDYYLLMGRRSEKANICVHVATRAEGGPGGYFCTIKTTY